MKRSTTSHSFCHLVKTSNLNLNIYFAAFLFLSSGEGSGSCYITNWDARHTTTTCIWGSVLWWHRALSPTGISANKAGMGTKFAPTLPAQDRVHFIKLLKQQMMLNNLLSRNEQRIPVTTCTCAIVVWLVTLCWCGPGWKTPNLFYPLNKKMNHQSAWRHTKT